MIHITKAKTKVRILLEIRIRLNTKGLPTSGVRHRSAKIGVLEVNLYHYGRGSPMSNITRVGVDLAKNLIQVHAVDAAGKVVTNRALKREKFLVLRHG